MPVPRDPFQPRKSQANHTAHNAIGARAVDVDHAGETSIGLVEGMRRFQAEQDRRVKADRTPSFDTPQAVEDVLRSLVADDRYRAKGAYGDRFRDAVSDAFQDAYPGTYVPGSWGRLPDGERIPPAVTLEGLEKLIRSRLDDALPPYVTPTVPEEPMAPRVDPYGKAARFTNHTAPVVRKGPEEDAGILEAVGRHLDTLDLSTEDRAVVEEELGRRMSSDRRVGEQVALAPSIPIAVSALLASLGISTMPKDEDSQRRMGGALDELIEPDASPEPVQDGPLESLPAPTEETLTQDDEKGQSHVSSDGPGPDDEDPNEGPPSDFMFHLLPEDSGGHLIHGGETPVRSGFRGDNRDAVEGLDTGIVFSDDQRREFDTYMQEFGSEALADREHRERENLGALPIAPSQSFIWNQLSNWRVVRGRNYRVMPGRTRNRNSYSWDSKHGEIEIFDRHGNHLGAIDGVTGEWTNGPRSDRQMNRSSIEEPNDGTAARSA